MSMAIVAGVAAVASVGVAAYSASQQGSIAGSQLDLANNTASKQNTSYNQLQDLINNPGSFLSNPLYQAAFGQGTQAVARSNAAEGFLGSGNAATALQQFGQGFAGQQLLGQEQLLASMSGTQAASSPSQLGAVASGANTSAFGQYGSLLASLGYQTAQNPGVTPMGTIAGGGGNTMDASGGFTFSY